MTDESEQKTLQDLFRVINDMRGDMNTRFDEAAAERQEMRVSIEEVKGETQAIREVVSGRLRGLGSEDFFGQCRHTSGSPIHA